MAYMRALDLILIHSWIASSTSSMILEKSILSQCSSNQNDLFPPHAPLFPNTDPKTSSPTTGTQSPSPSGLSLNHQSA
jgi:hypothetical protein